MADVLTQTIGELPTNASDPALSRASLLELENDHDESVSATIGEVADAMGDVKARGHVVGTGKIDDEIDMVIQAGVVTLAMQANIATNRLLGRSTAGSGAPETLVVGSGLTLAGGTLSASAPAAADPSTTALTRRFMHGF